MMASMFSSECSLALSGSKLMEEHRMARGRSPFAMCERSGIVSGRDLGLRFNIASLFAGFAKQFDLCRFLFTTDLQLETVPASAPAWVVAQAGNNANHLR